MGSHLGWVVVKPDTPNYICTELKHALVDEFADGQIEALYDATFDPEHLHSSITKAFLRGFIKGTTNADANHEANRILEALEQRKCIRIVRT